jgi:D-alanine-D-alanine ligase
MKNIAVIGGGYSSERGISLKSAKTVFENIDRNKFNVYKIQIDKDGWFGFDENDKKQLINRTDFSFDINGQKITVDCAFIVIHGTPGEDGKLQAYFDMLEIPYTTCSHLAATLTFNKFACNRFLDSFDIPVAKAVLIRKNEAINSSEIIERVGLPCFVKPADGGSSYGITKVENESELEDAVTLALKHGTQALIESFLKGREVTNGIYKSLRGIHVLPITEIVTENDFFDFDAKYKGESNEITPADLEEEMTKKIKGLTLKVYEILGFSGIARADYIIHDGEPHLIEINAVPGQSAESIIPKMAAQEGVSLKQLFEDVIQVALKA